MGELVPYNKGKRERESTLALIQDVARPALQRTIDYHSTVVHWLEGCLTKHALPSQRLQHHYSYNRELAPPFATPSNPYDSICCRFVHAAYYKSRSPVNVVHWYPHGRRLLSGLQSGHMIIWNGFSFFNENVMQAHTSAIKAMQWTPQESVLVTGDQFGQIKLWDQFIYNFQTFSAHKESICDISIAPTSTKFCSCADDSHAKVWDLRTATEERAFTGHGWDVKCCHWHPTKGLVATGSKDSQIKLWDPRASEAITTIFCHKSTVTKVLWSPNGQWLATGSRDQMVMLIDLKMLRVRKVLKAHQKEVTSLCWHPDTDALLASGGYEGAIHFWDTKGSATPIESVPNAHEGPVWSLSWHPLGHMMASGSNDYSTRFWSRARPGDTNFEELLPKRLATTAGELPPVPPPPSTSKTDLILRAGIFAGAPAPPLTEEEKAARAAAKAAAEAKAKAEAEARAAALAAAAAAAAAPPPTAEPEAPAEESKKRSLLDTSDFDEELPDFGGDDDAEDEVDFGGDDSGAAPSADDDEIAALAAPVSESAADAPKRKIEEASPGEESANPAKKAHLATEPSATSAAPQVAEVAAADAAPAAEPPAVSDGATAPAAQGAAATDAAAAEGTSASEAPPPVAAGAG
eukprot:CAMPEP_0178428582 /NCGR_PEP_ID=MMETSP0689_2-20121128/30355_1 /TAXON_ID=160604 /ORGANISM="Amphidinium massartii, Strain CS-259" /LENGTH=632 /DNA_ID=CAMNT_0020050365 /DNA_START=44 /DNA_END=1938 /DNA_ORIENTATION=-